MAAALVVGVFGIASLWHWNTDEEHEHLAASFNAYLDEFPDDPVQAQQVLLVNYGGRRVTLDQAADSLGYAPLAGVKTPTGYTIQDVYLLELPCCKCAQVVYRGSDGRLIAVFEHEKEQPIWFGDRPEITCQCGGQSTNLVEIDNEHLAATWKAGERYVTLIGAHNLEEVQELIVQLTQSS